MAFTFNGFGTTFYGQRDFYSDQSFVTTEWIVAAYLPLFPLRSLRVRYLGRSEPGLTDLILSSERYEVIERGSQDWKQVIYTYGYMVFVVAWIVFISMLFPAAFNKTSTMVYVVLAWTMPIALPFILRFFAKRRIRQVKK